MKELLKLSLLISEGKLINTSNYNQFKVKFDENSVYFIGKHPYRVFKTMENLKNFLLKIETKRMRIALIIQRLLMGAKKRRCMSMSKKRLLSIVVSAVILLSFACTAMAAEKSERYVGDSTVNGSIYQTYYQVDAQTRTGVKKISVSGVLYEKGTIGTWQKVSSCSNSSTTSTCMVSSSFNTKPGKSYRLEYSATFSYSDGRSETITGSTSR